MQKAFFIALEGGEGCGKSTQVKRLAEALSRAGFPAVATREPGGEPHAEAIRTLIMAHKNLEPETEMLLHMAARIEHVKKHIHPQLAKGVSVISDRFVASTIVYQGVAGGVNIPTVERQYRAVLGNFMPDLTLVLDVPVEVGLARATARGETNRYDALGLEFHEAVREGFLALAKREPSRYVIVDATQDVDKVAHMLLRNVSSYLGINLNA